MKALLLTMTPLLLVLTSCSNIRSKQLVGKEPIDLTQAIEDMGLSSIAGEWVNADGEITSITVTNAKEGEILYAPVGGDEDDEPVPLKLRMSGNHVFVNFPPDEDGERIWVLMRAQGDRNQILVWSPNVALFRKLVAEGKIKGTNDPETRKDEKGEEVKNHSPGAVIDDPSGEWVEKMVAGEFGVVFDWQDPTVLRRRVIGGEPVAEEVEEASEPADNEGQ